MKHLHLQSSNYKYLEQSFKQWLDVLGYAQRTVKGSPIQLRELFHYLEQKNITHLTTIKPRHLSDFLRHLKTRTNLTYGGGLSSSSINSYITSINLFVKYINQTDKHLLDFITKRISNEVNERTVLTQQEIKTLYQSTYEPHTRHNSRAIGQRDRAIIAIFYGCGLRKSEGSNLDLGDIDLIKQLVFVKKAKGNKQRYVPIAQKHSEDIRSYIEEGRYWFLQDNQSAWHVKKGFKKQDADKEAFFLNGQGKRMQSFDSRFRYMKEKSGINTPFNTHNLRHSIATHLLQSGMPIEEIAKFLGHGSLESTQIYTHIVKQLNDVEMCRCVDTLNS
ncbi:MAG: Tyrosine recombinase XerD [Flavobacteriales bacterium]|nr:Tyrosine recombinase XerD [Flavobacteriales bacterium]MBV6484837.1 Tyrosine recombinase XerD [Flavobacteriales bacterium]